MKSSRRSNPERSAEMRARLVSAARRLFVDQGYAAAGTPAIVDAAKATRGALYHHFPDKQALFRAVVEAESAAVADAIETADGPAYSPMASLLAGAAAYVQAMREEGRVRLLLVEGPAVLGRPAMRRIEAQHGDRSLKNGLAAAMAAGALPPLPIEALASVLSAMFERAAMDVADGMKAAHALTALEAILQGLASGTVTPGKTRRLTK
ncbi:MAG: helix-turn-helix domain containing protein [Magnetospirillum sp.]|nr:helix-turn-helix domain containing protein [Magnetospirillum sp.]